MEKQLGTLIQQLWAMVQHLNYSQAAVRVMMMMMAHHHLPTLGMCMKIRLVLAECQTWLGPLSKMVQMNIMLLLFVRSLH